MTVIHFYRTPGLPEGRHQEKLAQLKHHSSLVSDLKTELCFNIQIKSPLSKSDIRKLKWILSPALNQDAIKESPYLSQDEGSMIVEIGPRLNFSTPFSSNAISICRASSLLDIVRFEVSIRYLITWTTKSIQIPQDLKKELILLLHDKMTECQYLEPISNFNHGIKPNKWFLVDILGKGRKALEEVNVKLGLAFDDWDMDYYTSLFREKLHRNPTSVECFDLAQSNSEHSRHWFFKGMIYMNKILQPESLIDMIIRTQDSSNKNNVIKFSDNSSAIEGFDIVKIRPCKVSEPSKFETFRSVSHIIFTAETHNFPTGVAPFSGATTGTGGRIRDVQAVGRGGHCIAGTAGYSVGNLLIEDYELPWEDKTFTYPGNLALPVDILIEASNGASDYGNKFGEPVVCGFTRSFGLKDHGGERKEYVKPIMFSGGIGSVESNMITKFKPTPGMKVTKIGGPVYRIGVGGGSASSVQVQGDNESELDFGAVQRGDAEMENKLNRIIRACIEDSEGNPICSIHDQGAGGNGNVLKELVEPSGAVICTNNFTLGDESISTMELWGAEYQESNAVLVNKESVDKLLKLSHRERCQVDFVGTVTGNGKVILTEDKSLDEEKVMNDIKSQYPFNLDLELVLGNMPRKEFYLEDRPVSCKDLILPNGLSIFGALERVLKLASVSSKRFLTNKVDRCVTGLIAQQQCVGPLHTPLADYALTALSLFGIEGMATSIGEQPVKGIINPEAGARMTVSESLTNLMFAKISCLKDVKCSGNWMWAAKLPGEGGSLFRACKAMCDVMMKLGIAVDGGKDSLSMAARVEKKSIVSPGTLVVSTYAPCPDIRVHVTPDIKSPAKGKVGALLWVSLGSNHRLGGSALAQCFSQLGSKVPDLDNPDLLVKGFNLTQKLISECKILSGHDISDGGLITSILEMCFAGLSGLQMKLESCNPIELLFAEEVGWVLEVLLEDVDYVTELYTRESLNCKFIGQAVGYGMNSKVTIRGSNNDVLLDSSLLTLFSMWEVTSFKLECRQANVKCVSDEFKSYANRKGPNYKCTFNPEQFEKPSRMIKSAPRVAVIREEGTNGDREMSASFYMTGFEVWDVTMQDLLDKKVTTDHFQGIIFPGGFSYADVLGSAKGWAASLLFNDILKAQLAAFKSRTDTFSFGVCNGCQLMGLLGWVSPEGTNNETSIDIVLDHNLSERFECRFSTVRIENTPAIMCKGMEGSVLGVWIAHGEGRFTFKNETVRSKLQNKKLMVFKYVDDDGRETEQYPMNPNGSPGGLAGVCSPDGRHLAMMPHPERCSLMWEWPYVSPSVEGLKTSPWLRLFQNAYIWAVNNSQ